MVDIHTKNSDLLSQLATFKAQCQSLTHHVETAENERKTAISRLNLAEQQIETLKKEIAKLNEEGRANVQQCYRQFISEFANSCSFNHNWNLMVSICTFSKIYIQICWSFETNNWPRLGARLCLCQLYSAVFLLADWHFNFQTKHLWGLHCRQGLLNGSFLCCIWLLLSSLLHDELL